MTMMVLLGLGSSVCWGTADFFGGLQSRRLPALAVALWSQCAGGLVLLLVLLASREPPVLDGIVWGIVAGFFGGAGLLFFYRGLAAGVMSIVAPIAACGAIVPVGVAMALGEAPSVLAWFGIAAAIAGIVLVSLHPAQAPQGTGSRSTIILALGAATSFGFFFVFLDQASAGGGASPLWAIGGARIGSLAMLLALVLAGRRPARWPGRHLGAVALVGIVDTTANGLFAYASTLGNLGIVSVLASLYPVVTVLLGRFMLAERLTGTQVAGVILALGGVALISGG